MYLKTNILFFTIMAIATPVLFFCTFGGANYCNDHTVS